MTVTVTQVTFEHHREALGIGERRPRLSWKVTTVARNWVQTDYEIQMTAARSATPWSSGRVHSPDSVLVPWTAPELHSRERRLVRVRVWGNASDRPSEWSSEHAVEAGLLDAADWTAAMVSPDLPSTDVSMHPAPLLRHEFQVRAQVAAARLYVTAQGVYEIEINGARVGDHVLAPGWTSYAHRHRYQTFDVTALLESGRNAIGAILADGWFCGRLGFHGGRRNIYGDNLAVLAQLEILNSNGTREVVISNGNWRAASGPIVDSGIYDGESYDARLERDGWSTAGHDARAWAPVKVLAYDPTKLVAPNGPPVRRIQTVQPQKILKSRSGGTIIDFGQNLVGRVRVRVRGEAGQAVTLRHSEVLQDGELCVLPLRQARATDHYTLKGGGVEEWEPRFTYHGFQYVEVKGNPQSLELDDISAIVCHSDMERTGWFESSDPTLNRFHENVIWSMRGNFVDIPTDCPQRDERLGWTGDIQVFAPTAAFLYDCAGTLRSWLADLAAEQAERAGVPPDVVPDVLTDRTPAHAGWGDAAVIVPWVLYQRFGDVEFLRAQYGSMAAWVDAVALLAGDDYLWNTGDQLGDWLDPSAPPDRPEAGATDPHLVATAYLARSATLLALAANIIGLPADAERYSTLAGKVSAAFRREFVSPAGRLVSDSQTAITLALEFGLFEAEDQRTRAGRRLVDLVREKRHRVGTGFLGTPLICDALTAVGATEDAYGLLMQRECPSWLYAVTMGATTVWERWDSLNPEGNVNTEQMTSFNHYAFGSVADWIHRTVGGLAPAAPGFRAIMVRPQIGKGVTHAHVIHETPYGRAEVEWKVANGILVLTATIPPGCHATVMLPGLGGDGALVGSGRHEFRSDLRAAKPKSVPD